MHILIATYRRTELLQRTLCSLAAARLPEGLGRVWVLENGPDAAAKKVCDQMMDRLPIHHVHLPQPGKSRALQWAVEQIQQGPVVFLDDDVRVHPQMLTAYDQALRHHGHDKFFGGPLRIDYEQPPPSWLRPHLPRSVTGWEPADPEAELRNGVTFLGANFAVRAERILAVGGFNVAIGPGAHRAGTDGNPMGQETVLQQRLLTHGHSPIYVPDALVWHYVPAERCSAHWALHRIYRYGLTSGIRSADRTLPPWLWRARAQSEAVAVIARCVPAARKRFEWQLPAYKWRGYWHGLTHDRKAA